MPDNAAHEGLERLRNVWRYDPTMAKRIDADLEAFERYVEVRSAHVALSHAPAPEYDPDAVKAADNRRTRAHNDAIRAASDINRCCELAGTDPIAPTCPAGLELTSKAHRNAVAHFVADVLQLTDDERRGLDLK